MPSQPSAKHLQSAQGGGSAKALKNAAAALAAQAASGQDTGPSSGQEFVKPLPPVATAASKNNNTVTILQNKHA